MNSNNGNSIYVMGVAPGKISGITIIGVPYLSMYGNIPYRKTYLESFETEGSYTAQALEICDASREFYPLAMVVESRYPEAKDLNPVAERIAFCHETHYIINTFFWQEASQAIPDSKLREWGLPVSDSTRHVMTFLRRAKDDNSLRDAAWGPVQRKVRPTKATRARPARRLYFKYERAKGRMHESRNQRYQAGSYTGAERSACKIAQRTKH